METSATVGIVANPASARDLRRIVARGGAVTTHDKLNRLQRILTGVAAAGVDHVISMADGAGIMAGLLRLAEQPSGRTWPTLDFVDQLVTGTAADTTTATRAMVDAGVGAIVVLGGDGTNRVVAASSADVPLVSVSTGTNNTFPRPVEPTVAGLAAGIVARDHRCRGAATHRAKRLLVECGDRVELALVDVAVSSADGVGAGAVWDATSISRLYLCFAEADAIGLSAIGGHLRPTARHDPSGLALVLGEPPVTVVHPPIGPGLVTPVGVKSVSRLDPDSPVEVRATTGVLALDGERQFRFGPSDRPTVTLRSDGPVVVDVPTALHHAAALGLLAPPAGTGDRPVPATGDRPPISRETTSQNPKGDGHETTASARALHRDGPHPAVRVQDPAGIPR